ncbi:MAG: LysM peptidoglycan-binding domain-containing protein [Defluviitaleaceae bacterium]|nr:LysM peptidoglycan-binding domain-containing protein [Defluviitaleaceae bacterium]
MKISDIKKQGQGDAAYSDDIARNAAKSLFEEPAEKNTEGLPDDFVKGFDDAEDKPAAAADDDDDDYFPSRKTAPRAPARNYDSAGAKSSSPPKTLSKMLESEEAEKERSKPKKAAEYADDDEVKDYEEDMEKFRKRYKDESYVPTARDTLPEPRPERPSPPRAGASREAGHAVRTQTGSGPDSIKLSRLIAVGLALLFLIFMVVLVVRVNTLSKDLKAARELLDAAPAGDQNELAIKNEKIAELEDEIEDLKERLAEYEDEEEDPEGETEDDPENPQPTQQPTPQPTSPPSMPSTYTVADGDTLTSIARKMYPNDTSPAAISANIDRIVAASESLPNRDAIIRAGMILNIPRP